MTPAIIAIPSKDGEKIRIWWPDHESAQRGMEAAGISTPPVTYYPAGRHNLMIAAAVNYCLGRSTYITGDCADWLISIWPALDDRTRNIIRRDIDKAFARDDEDREAGRAYKALGDDCDRQQWERVRKLWKEQP